MWNGSIDFLLGCGFVFVVASAASSSSSNKKGDTKGSKLLKLENENISQLLFGRNELIKFAVGVIKMDVGALPPCPANVVGGGGMVVMDDDDKEVVAAVVGVDKSSSSLDYSSSKRLQLEVPEEEGKEEGTAKKKNDVGGRGGNDNNASDTSKRRSSDSSKTNSFDKKIATTTTDPETTDEQQQQQSKEQKQHSKEQNNNQLITQPAAAVPVVTNSSFSLEHIQMLTEKERQESIIEAKRLKDEEKLLLASASASLSAAATRRRSASTNKFQQEEEEGEESNKLKAAETVSCSSSSSSSRVKEMMEGRQRLMEQQRLVHEAEEDRERRMIELRKGGQEGDQMIQQRAQLLPTMATSDEQEQQQQRMKSNKSKSQSDSPIITANNHNNKISTLKITTSAASSLDPALSDEMTDLLDEIENELNDDWFDESPDKEDDDENNNNDLDDKQSKDGPGYYVDPSADTASLCEHENEELVGEGGPDVETCVDDNIYPSSTTITTTSEENAGNDRGGGGRKIRPSMLERRRVRLEQKHVEEERGAVDDAKSGEKDDDNDTNFHDGPNSDVKNSTSEPPMHLPETVEKLVESSSTLENIPSSNSGVSQGIHHGSSIVVDENAAADMTVNGHDMNKSASDLLDDLESDSVVANPSTATGSNSVQPIDVKNEKINSQDRTNIDVVGEQYADLSSKSTVEEVRNKSATEMEVESHPRASTTDNASGPYSHSNHFTSHSPLDSHNTGYSDLFKNIPLPEGEFSSSDNDEDVRRFCQGFELCHRSLFSIWSTMETCVYNDAVGKNTSTSSHYCTDTITAGLPNIIRIRLIWEDESNSPIQKPVILVPLVYVYTAWACILGLKSSHTSNRTGVQQGKMYSWLVSNHQQLSVFDDITVSESLDEFTHLPETSIAVCNYVCKALRDIGLVSMYRTEASREATSQSNLFVGIDSDVFDNCIQKQEGGNNALDNWLLHDCHGILAQLVYPRILDGIANNSIHDTQASNLVWYSCRHAVRHLTASGRLNESKSLLFDTNFIRLRLQILGVLGGTVAHCRDCSRLDVSIAEAVDEWRRNQLQAVDMKRELSSLPLDDYGNHDPAAARAPDVAGWKEDHFKILCSVSEALREKAGEVASNNDHHFDENEKRNLQKDIGNSMQMIGECIGDIGVYRPQEMEHYEESLRLKSEAYGDVDHPDIADILVSRLAAEDSIVVSFDNLIAIITLHPHHTVHQGLSSSKVSPLQVCSEML